jgi:RHS repeat-associated protein
VAASVYGFNGKEKDDEVKGSGNSYDFGARMYDSRIGRWLAVDPLAGKYPHSSPYVFVLNTPLQAIDPDGRLTIYVSGACHDCDGRGYILRIVNAAKLLGIKSFHEINAHSSSTIKDIYFAVGEYSTTPAKAMFDLRPTKWERDEFGVKIPTSFEKVPREVNWRIKSAVNQIEELYKTKKDGEQFNLVGTSAGSVIQAQAALILAEKGYVIDNLILDGSPIPEDSELYKALTNNKNIKNVIRRDLSGDNVSEVGDKSILEKMGVLKDLLTNDKHSHFDVSRTEDGPKKLVEYMKGEGVE